MECLNDTQVFDLVGGLMDRRAREPFEAHVRDCEKCTAKVRESNNQLMARTFSPRQVAKTDSGPGGLPKFEDFDEDEITEPEGLKGGMPETGKVLGQRYKLVKVLGHGGMGVVYEAHDEALNITVALKLLVRELARHASFVEQMHQEIRLGRRITSPRVCRVHDLGTDGKLHFIVMEHVPGQTLEARIQQGPVPFLETAAILDQLCDALEAAEEAGVVHRDLKPANVMLDERGKVKVMDFGLARDLKVDRSQYGVAKGTPAYWAPEQARGEPATAASDIFAVGMIALDLFSGKFPWQRSAAEALVLLPLPYQAVISRCLEMDPLERYPTANGLRRALEEALRQAQFVRTVVPRKMIFGVSAAGALAAIGVFLLLVWPTPVPVPQPTVVPDVAPQQPAAPYFAPVIESTPEPVVEPVVEAPKEATVKPVPKELRSPSDKPEQVAAVTPVPEVLTAPPDIEQTEVVQPPAPTDSAELRAVVLALSEELGQQLRHKALLSDDLPGWSKSMEQARSLIQDGKPEQGKALLSQLTEQLASARVDAKLVSKKLNRLNGELKALNLPAEKSAPLYKLFEQVQAAYFNGDYAAANRSLNEIKAALDRS